MAGHERSKKFVVACSSIAMDEEVGRWIAERRREERRGRDDFYS